MVQRKRIDFIHPGRHATYNVHKEMEMKKPVELWQMIIGLITFGIGLATIAINVSNKITNHESRIQTLERVMDKVDLKLDAIGVKQDKQDEKTTQILIILQNKQDRK